MRYLWWQNLLSSPLCPHCPVGSQNMCNEHVRKTEPKGLKGGLGTNFPTFLAPWTLHMRKWRRRVKKASSCHAEGRIFSGAALLGLGDRAWRSRGTHLQPPWLTITCILFLLLCPSFRLLSLVFSCLLILSLKLAAVVVYLLFLNPLDSLFCFVLFNNFYF